MLLVNFRLLCFAKQPQTRAAHPSETWSNQSTRLDVPPFPCNLSLAWRRHHQLRRQAICSLRSRKLPLCSPSGGAWSRAAHCLVPASVQPPSHFSRCCCGKLFPQRPIVVVVDGLKAQESFQQDIETWLRFAEAAPSQVADAIVKLRSRNSFFYPAWEILPHEAKLPHADVISERLETLVALAGKSARRHSASRHGRGQRHRLAAAHFSGAISEGAHADTESRRPHLDPLDLVEWLESQGYEPEAQVTQKGEIALRGGILDVYPMTSPWPVRLEFFGDEVESLRHFDPHTQISRDPIVSVRLPPAANWGFCKSGRRSRTATAPKPRRHRPWPRCWIICRVTRFSCCANRTGWPRTQGLNRNKFQPAILSSLIGRIFAGNWPIAG